MISKDPEEVSWFPELTEGEEVQYWEHPSIIPAIPGFVVGTVGVLSGIAGFFFTPLDYYALLLVPFGTLLFLSEYVQRITTHYILTDKKVIRKTGILSVNPRDLDYSDVEDVDPMQGKDGIVNAIIERHLFGYGDIYLTSASGTELELDNVASYQEFYDFMSMKNSETTVRDVVAEHMGGEEESSEQPEKEEKEEVEGEEENESNSDEDTTPSEDADTGEEDPTEEVSESGRNDSISDASSEED